MRFSTKSDMPPAKRTGPRNVLAFQTVTSACWTAGPYRGGRCQRRHFVGSATRMVSPRTYRCPAPGRTAVRISPAIPRRFTEVVQHHRLLCFPRLPICLCLDHREFLPFLHCEPHSRGSVLIQRIRSILSSFTSIFS